MSDPLVLARMMRHTPPDRLAWRAFYLAKRRLRQGLAEAGFDTPLAWGTRAHPRAPARWPTAQVPAVHPDATPHAVDLHGLSIDLEPPIAWTRDQGFDGTDLQQVHLHEHAWIAALPDRELMAVLDDWMARVRPYGPRYWVASWNSYTLAGRVLSWLRQIAARDLPQAFVVRTLASTLEQLAFLSRNLERDLRGNHLLRNLAALAWGSACFDGPDAAAWRATVERLLPGELDHQILDDGLHFELSPAYHLQVMTDLLSIYAALPPSPARERLHRALRAMASAAATLVHPDGGPSLFSDAGLHMAPPTADLLACWASLSGESVPPAPPVHLFERAGYAVYRDAVQTLVADCGPIAASDLPAHGHADALSFEWSVGGQRVIVDAGVPHYQAGPERLASRGTAVHNTLTLDDADQAELFGSFRTGRRPTVTRTVWAPRGDGFVLAGHHDGYAHLPGRPIHHRRFDLRGGRLHIQDRVEGGRGQRAAARLLLHPHVRVEPDGSALVLSLGPHRIRVRSTAPLRVEEAVWWPDFGAEHPTQRIVIDLGQAPCEGSTTLEIDGM